MFGDVIQKSLKLIIIIFICIIGFLLSFRNRANYTTTVTNTIPYFNSSFELDLFKVLTMVIGNVGTDNMGLDNMVNIYNFFFLYLFICIFVYVIGTRKHNKLFNLFVFHFYDTNFIYKHFHWYRYQCY